MRRLLSIFLAALALAWSPAALAHVSGDEVLRAYRRGGALAVGHLQPGRGCPGAEGTCQTGSTRPSGGRGFGLVRFVECPIRGCSGQGGGAGSWRSGGSRA